MIPEAISMTALDTNMNRGEKRVCSDIELVRARREERNSVVFSTQCRELSGMRPLEKYVRFVKNDRQEGKKSAYMVV